MAADLRRALGLPGLAGEALAVTAGESEAGKPGGAGGPHLTAAGAGRLTRLLAGGGVHRRGCAEPPPSDWRGGVPRPAGRSPPRRDRGCFARRVSVRHAGFPARVRGSSRSQISRIRRAAPDGLVTTNRRARVRAVLLAAINAPSPAQSRKVTPARSTCTSSPSGWLIASRRASRTSGADRKSRSP